jgi:hypothetical protein
MSLTVSAQQEPSYWHLLSSDDSQAYLKLCDHFQSTTGKSAKGERLDAFSYRLGKIREFIERNDQSKWQRSLVCGVFFLREGMALNIRQLRLLLGKCKSSINGSLQQMGYTAKPQLHSSAGSFLRTIPDGLELDLKNWTIRMKSDPPEPFIVPLPVVTEEPSRAEDVEPANRIPCPVKWRYKFWDAIRSVPSCESHGSIVCT